MKVLIIGFGYVGSAVASIFKQDEKIIIDPKYTRLRINDVSKNKFDLVFVCVDTPIEDKFKTLDTVLKDLNKLLPKNVVCCKSTAPPHIYEQMSKKYNNITIVHSPEFLSHHSNIRDFNCQDFIILGGKKQVCKKIQKILCDRIPSIKKTGITDIKTAALIKYAENAFLAYKVTFFNELFDIHKNLKLKSKFNDMVNLLTLDNRIGKSFTSVPGRDGRRGWGGHCFTKDNLELQLFTKSKLIEFMRKINKIHRSK